MLEALYYFLPVFMANGAPPLVAKLSFLNRPINKKLFGENKTVRGFVFACIFGTLTFFIQTLLYKYPGIQSISLIDYSGTTLWLGFLLSFGAISGDLIESYFKRKMRIKPGRPWIPFDQTDFVIGAFLFSFFIFIPNIKIIITIVICSMVLTMISHYLGYLLGINKDKI
ncbi:MAG: CDP-archaeol synthase [archaeon]